MSKEKKTYVREPIKDAAGKYIKLEKQEKSLFLCSRKTIKENNGEIIGYFNNKDKIEDKKSCDIEEKIFSFEKKSYIVRETKHRLHFVKGYVYVGNNQYIGFQINALVVIVPFVTIVVIIIGMMLLHKDQPNAPIFHPFENTTYVPDENADATKDEVIKFAGYGNIIVTKNEPEIYLQNPKENDVYFTYTVKDKTTQKVLLKETGLIEHGKAFKWNAYDLLKKGENKVVFHVNTFDSDDNYTPCNTTNIDVNITKQ